MFESELATRTFAAFPTDTEVVGEIILFSQRLADRSRPAISPAAFFFALDCPISYLAMERVERALGEIEWIPVLGPTSEPDPLAMSESERCDIAYERLMLAERQANSLGLPLVEPHKFPVDSREASRVAVCAAEQGAGAAFALAAARLVFCGGFDLAHREVIVEAAAVAGLRAGDALKAARSPSYDLRLDATTLGLSTRKIDPPAVRIGTNWFQGLDAVSGASSFRASRSAESSSSSAS